jgi:hypothetical protein
MGLIRDIIAIKAEEARQKKALRILAKQKWSIEFLTTLLQKAANAERKSLEMTIMDPEGRVLKVTALNTMNASERSDNIFDHLDDDYAIKRFMEQIRK